MARVGRRRLLGAAALTIMGGSALLRLWPGAAQASQTMAPGHPLLLITNSSAGHLSFVDPGTGAVERVEVGAAPWAVRLSPDGALAYVSTAEGLAVVDTAARQRTRLLPYQAQAEVGAPGTGEYRPGGMGLAVAPDGRRVYVVVHLPGGPSRLEVFDAEQQGWAGSATVGLRPFDVLVSPDGREAYSIDHDSYSVTVVDAETLATRELTVAPLGRGAFDKPHYAALGSHGRLLLPVQGRALVELDPAAGAARVAPLTADSHQHGVAVTPDRRQLLVVGTGPAGGARGGPSLTIRGIAGGEETVLPLARPHERVALSPDGRWAYLTGGYLLGGWDGLTVVDLADRTTREVALPDGPLDVVPLTPRSSPEASRELIAAAARGDADEVRRLLAVGAGVHAADAGGRTALIAAAYGRHNEVARLLIEAGADVNRRDGSKQSAYLIPTADGNVELLRITLAAGADVQSKDSYNGTGLIRSADRGHADVIAELLQTPIAVDHVNRLGWTALLEAVILGDGGPRHAECVRLLLAAGADPNLADRQGVTPLGHARRKGQSEVVKLLEGAGAR
jgi:ankyrin repeat protein/DNA-binding beta-propeller fold protein YncE